MNDRIFALRLFSRVAYLGSFSKAGKELNLSQPSVSRIISSLENDVGVALLTRTTRAMTLTEAGADYLERIEPLLVALEEADLAARGTGELRGILRVGVSSGFAIREMIPRLSVFMIRHPALRIELLMNDQRQDLIGEGVDVAIRMGALTDSTATAHLLGANQRLLVASPDYLQQAGAPVTPADLPPHSIVMNLPGQSQAGWSFTRDGRTLSVRVESKLLITTNEGAVAAATVGLGIVSTGFWGCRKELETGALVRVLPDWEMEPVEVNALFAAGRAAKPSARAFAAYLAESLREFSK